MQIITYTLLVPTAYVAAVLSDLQDQGHIPVSRDDEIGGCTRLIYEVKQPSDFYIMAHNLQRAGIAREVTSR